MALSPKIFSLFLLTLLSSHIHARESQFFSKIPSNTNNVDTLKEAQIIPQNQEDPLNKPNQEPDFIPENTDDGFGHESGQLPPTTTSTTTNTNLPYDNQPNEFLPKYLPKNYNTESYVTEPEGYHPVQDTNNNYYNNNDANAYQKQSYPTTSTKTTNLPYDNEPNDFSPKYLPKNYNTESYVSEPEGYHPVQETNNHNYNYNNDVNEYQKESYPTTTTTNTNLPYNKEPNAKYLPKNYNTESYVTEPEGYHSVQETNNNNYNNDVDTYQKEAYPATSSTTTSGDNYYANGNTYNGQGQGVNEFKLGQKSYGTNAVERQGMSDTRYLENGKYYYDLNLEKNNRYPFKSIGGFGDQNENSYDLNKYSDDGFENQGEQFQDFQDEQDLP